MPDSKTLPIAAEHREFTIKVGGTEIDRAHQLLAVNVVKTVNKIASARLVYLDGTADSSDFPLSNTNQLIPGQEIEILAGTGSDLVSLFQGIIIQQQIKIRDHTAPQLIVDCRHRSVKLTVGRKSAYFFDQTDSDMISQLLDQAGIEADVQALSVPHPQQVQYDCTDWDFLLTRAEANGLLVLTNTNTVTIKAPDFSRSPVCTLQFGSTILEMDAAIDARSQFSAVKSMTWDAAQQTVVEKEANEPSLSSPGNLASADLAAVMGLEQLALRHGALLEAEAQAWADAQWLKSKMSRVSGRLKCEGLATVNPGDLVRLSGVGDRYNGNVFITGVRQDFDLVQGWKTHLQFGNMEQWLAAEHNSVTAPKAAALLPGINGLQIGLVVSNEDPEGEDRIRVKMPLVNAEDEGTWARLATLDAGQERGFCFRPEVNDEVILGFINDDPRQAVILGMVHSSAKPAPIPGSDDNHEKVYQSRSKMKLYFDDDQKIMQLATPAGNQITLSEADKGITIEDQNGNKIAMNSDGIKIESRQAIELKAGTEFKIESGTALNLKGGTELKLEGTAGAEISSTATTKVKGGLVQIN